MGRRSPLARGLVLLAMFASLAATGDAVQCYTCSTVTDSKCADPFAEGTGATGGTGVRRVECTPAALETFASDVSRALAGAAAKLGIADLDVPRGAAHMDFVCQKIKYRDVRGFDAVLRSCAFRPDDSTDTCPPQKDDGTSLCLQCKGNLCNAAPAAPAGALPLLALALALARLLRP